MSTHQKQITEPIRNRSNRNRKCSTSNLIIKSKIQTKTYSHHYYIIKASPITVVARIFFREGQNTTFRIHFSLGYEYAVVFHLQYNMCVNSKNLFRYVTIV